MTSSHGAPARSPHLPMPASSPWRGQPAIASRHVIVIGGAQGDVAGLQAVLTGLAGMPFAIVAAIDLHWSFAERTMTSLQDTTGFRVKIAEPGDEILPGQVLLRPPDSHIVFRGSRRLLSCQLQRHTPECDHRHAIDFLLMSAAETAGSRILGILLAGCGDRGSQGLHVMQQHRCLTAREIVLEKPGSVLLPGQANRGCAAELVPLAGLASWARMAAAERPMLPPWHIPSW